MGEGQLGIAGSAFLGRARQAVGLLDLTSLETTDTEEAISALCDRALTRVGPVAAVCVYPRFVGVARNRLQDTGVRIATVVNFPAGDGDLAQVVADAAAAVAAGADEIDMVFPWRAWRQGQRSEALGVLLRVRQEVRSQVLKVILETGQFGAPEEIRDMASAVVAAGADFLKTSTGKTTPAATPEAVRVLLEVAAGALAEGRRIGVKPAGGIRRCEDAVALLELADEIMGKDWLSPEVFRLGASSLLDALLLALGAGEGGWNRSAY